MKRAEDHTIISNYLKVRSLGQGAMGEVFEVLSLDDPTQRFAVKFINDSQQNWAGLLHRFHKEASLMSQLYHPNVISLREFGILQSGGSELKKDASTYYIVMDFVDGQNLKHILKSNGARGMSLKFFFTVATQMARALDYTHSKNIIHRDVKPHNIIIEKSFRHHGGVKACLIDFGVAVLSEATNYIGGDQADALDKVVGTPLYMAPEINDPHHPSFDHRIDLYSLGCVFYEILTGRPPFLAHSRKQLQKLHAEAQPAPMSSVRNDIPQLVSQIIHRLLDKDPGKRYPTAFSLYSDLRTLEAHLLHRHTPHAISSRRSTPPTPTIIGVNDGFRSKGRSLKLVGRSRQITELIEFYNNVAYHSARGHISVVSGASGSGKSRLLSEIKEYFVFRKIKFISSSFIKYKPSIAMQSFASGFDEYLLKVMHNQPLEARNIKTRIKKTVGPRIHLLTQIVPSLSFYLEKGERGKGLAFSDGNDDDFQFLSKAFTDFTRCLLSFDQPIVFIFDDIEFADQNALKIISDFFILNNSERIHLIISCNDEDSLSRKPYVKDFLEKISQFNRRYQKLDLNPLTLHQVSQLIYHMLGVDVKNISPLCSQLYRICQGNPVFIIEKMRDLVLEGELQHSASERSWVYDLKGISSLKRTLTSVDLILSRINTYSDFNIQVLEVAAVMGMAFREDVLSMISPSKSSKLIEALDFLEEESLIDKEKIIVQNSGNIQTYCFTHPHIRDVLLGRIDEQKKCAYHLAIAEELSSRPTRMDDKIIFAMANHYYQGLRIKNPYIKPNKKTYDQAISYACRAGIMALRQEEHLCALRYYEFACLILKKKSPKSGSLADRFFLFLECSRIQIHQKLYHKALKNISHLIHTFRKTPLSNLPFPLAISTMETYLLLLCRTSNFQIVKHMSFSTLKRISSENMLPRHGRWQITLKLRLGLLQDYLFFALGLKWIPSPSKSLISQFLTSTQNSASRPLMFWNFAYRSELHLTKDLTTLMLIHLTTLDRLKQSGPHYIDDVLQLARIRLDILHYFGLHGTAKKVMGTLKKVLSHKHQENKRIHALYRLMEACTQSIRFYHDYTPIKNFMLSQKDQTLSVQNDMLHLMDLHAAHCTRLLLQGNKEEAPAALHYALKLCSSRSSILPYILALSAFQSTLEGSREGMQVFIGKLLLNQKIKKIHESNIFFSLARSYMLLLDHQFQSSQKAYEHVISSLKKNNYSLAFLPFMMDFALFALLLFRFFYEHGSKSPLLSDPEQHIEHLSILQTTLRQHLSSHCLTELMLKAQHILLLPYKESQRLDRNQKIEIIIAASAKKHFRIMNIFSLIIMGYFQRKNESKEGTSLYFKEALNKSRELRLVGIVRVVENILIKEHIHFARRDLRGGIEKTTSQFDRFPTTLAYQQLHHNLAVMHMASTNMLMEKSIAFFSSSYGGECFYHVILKLKRAGKPQITAQDILSHGPAPPNLADFLQSYLSTAEETLFLEIKDSWNVTCSSHIPTSQEESDFAEKVAAAEDPSLKEHSENPQAHNLPLPSLDASSSDTDLTQTASTHTIVQSNTFVHQIIPQRNRRTGCLVPLRLDQHQKHFVFVDNIGEGYLVDKKKSQEEMNFWGQQMGSMLIAKNVAPIFHRGRSSKQWVFQNHSYIIEPCAWLNTHAPPFFLTEKNCCSWMLGLNLSAHQYLIVHCELYSQHDEGRKTLGQMLWNHVSALALAALSGQRRVLPHDIKEDLVYFLNHHPFASTLSKIKGSISLIDAKKSHLQALLIGAVSGRILSRESMFPQKSQAIFRFAHGGVLEYQAMKGTFKVGSPWVIANGLADWSLKDQDYEKLSHSFKSEDIQGVLSQRNATLRQNKQLSYFSCMLKGTTQSQEVKKSA